MIAIATDWHNQMTAVVSLCSLLLCIWVLPRFGFSAAALLAFCLASAIWVWVFKDNRYLGLDAYNQMALRYFAADSIAKIVMICLPLMLLSEDRVIFSMVGTVIASAFVLASSAVALYEARRGCQALSCGGLIGNPSISMGLLVCVLPILVRSMKWQFPVVAMVSMAVFLSQSSIAVGLLAMYAGLWLFPWKEMSVKRVGIAGLVAVAILGFSRLMLGSELVNDSDRFMIWKHMMTHWAAPGNLLFGTGLGSYHVFSILLQNIPGQPVVSSGSWWNSLHNDWLEMVFCGGAVGALLLFSTYCSALLKLYRERDWQPLLSCVLFGVYMFLDPALRNPLPVLFGAWLFVYALRKPKEYLV